MKILVVGGTGTVGSQVVRDLAGKADIRVLSRSVGKTGNLPSGVQATPGDLAKPETLRGAFEGIERVFMITPISQTETQEGLAAVEAAQRAGVRRMVYMTVHRLEAAPHIPHFVSKLPIVAAIKASGMDYTFIEPNNFFQNDLWFKDVLLQHGIYPQPIGGAGVSRVDVRDIALAAVNALLQDGHSGQSYPVAGPELMTGESTAAAWSRVIGKPVRYAGDDVDTWEAQAKAMLPAWMAHDLRIMYETFQKTGLKATEGDLLRQQRILGRAPRRFAEWAGETAALWKS